MRKEFFALGLIGSLISGCDTADPPVPPVSDSGTSECVPGTVKCGEFCVDLKTDIYHCGSCSHNCETILRNAAGVCNGSGNCKIRVCSQGWADCDGRNPPFDPYTEWEPNGAIIQSGQDNGCETKITDPKNRCKNFDAGK